MLQIAIPTLIAMIASYSIGRTRRTASKSQYSGSQDSLEAASEPRCDAAAPANAP